MTRFGTRFVLSTCLPILLPPPLPPPLLPHLTSRCTTLVCLQEGGNQKRKVIVYDTDGTNLAQVLTNPYVDHTRTISNDMCEILRVRLGLQLFGVAGRVNVRACDILLWCIELKRRTHLRVADWLIVEPWGPCHSLLCAGRLLLLPCRRHHALILEHCLCMFPCLSCGPLVWCCAVCGYASGVGHRGVPRGPAE